MEKFNDIISNIKDRFSNPLIFSFICSWLVINWPITICLIWYDPDQIKLNGYASIFSFIACNLDTWKAIIQPLIFALLYTIFIPIIRNLIEALYAWANKWGNEWKLKISKDGKVSVEKYLRFRKFYEERTKLLEGVIESESKALTDFNDLQNKFFELDIKYNETKNNNLELKNQIILERDVKFLDGNWINFWKDLSKKNSEGTESIFIENGNYYIIQETKRELAFKISQFNFDKDTGSLFFIKDRINQTVDYSPPNMKFNINILKIQENNKNVLTGIENSSVEIRYVRN